MLVIKNTFLEVDDTPHAPRSRALSEYCPARVMWDGDESEATTTWSMIDSDETWSMNDGDDDGPSGETCVGSTMHHIDTDYSFTYMVPFMAAAAPLRTQSKSMQCMPLATLVPPTPTPPSGALKTSLFIRNLPEYLTRSMLMDLFSAHGFAESIDFLYLPVDLESLTIFGYAFVNFGSAKAAGECMVELNGFSDWNTPSKFICEVSWSKCQGLVDHVEKYKDSRIMHSSVDDEFKPALFRNGCRVLFPHVSKPPSHSRAPRRRKIRDVDVWSAPAC